MDTLEYDPADPGGCLDRLGKKLLSFGTLKRAVVSPEGLEVSNLNGDRFLILGLSFGDANLIPVLRRLGASFNPETLHNVPPNAEKKKELEITARYPWAKDRIL